MDLLRFLNHSFYTILQYISIFGIFRRRNTLSEAFLSLLITCAVGYTMLSVTLFRKLLSSAHLSRMLIVVSLHHAKCYRLYISDSLIASSAGRCRFVQQICSTRDFVDVM